MQQQQQITFDKAQTENCIVVD